ncbi:MAG: hypothetical protein ACKOAH_18200, partial [Pirellula sp.]
SPLANRSGEQTQFQLSAPSAPWWVATLLPQPKPWGRRGDKKKFEVGSWKGEGAKRLRIVAQL